MARLVAGIFLATDRVPRPICHRGTTAVLQVDRMRYGDPGSSRSFARDDHGLVQRDPSKAPIAYGVPFSPLLCWFSSVYHIAHLRLQIAFFRNIYPIITLQLQGSSHMEKCSVV